MSQTELVFNFILEFAFFASPLAPKKLFLRLRGVNTGLLALRGTTRNDVAVALDSSNFQHKFSIYKLPGNQLCATFKEASLVTDELNSGQGTLARQK